MARIFIKSNREPFEVSLEVAKKLRNDWLNEEIPRTQKIAFRGFAGMLGDIKSFDMRTEREETLREPSPLTPPLTSEERARGEKWIKEIKEMLKGKTIKND